jgi:hypothetical protein
MELHWTTEPVGPVTLVRVRLRNERTVDRRVRLQNLFDGPVLPPRRNGEPEAGWDRDGVTTVVPAGESVALGYACPAPAADPPVETASVGPVETTGPDEASASDAIRRLGDARPPRAVLGAEGETAGTAGHNARQPDGDPAQQSARDAADAEPPQRGLPAEADELLEPYRQRVRTVEALSLASVSEAAPLLDATGGLAGVEETGTRLAGDAAELRALAAAATALAARAEAAAPPTESLRRLS